MEIIITKHIADRAKERFRFTKATLERMFIKALESDSQEYLNNGKYAKKYKHINYIYEKEDNKYILVTIMDLQSISKYKEEVNKTPVYRKGVNINNYKYGNVKGL